MPSHMNVFVPYERPPTHEDQITRAFLIVLRAVPVAHAAWLELVASAHRASGGKIPVPPLHALPSPHIKTQTAEVPSEMARLISLLQTDDHFQPPDRVETSDRRQVLDGLVTYGTELAIALENKPSAQNVRIDQLHVNLGDAPSEVHDPTVACVLWSLVIQAWNRLLDAGLLGVAERVLISDFLDLAEEYFPSLLPYSSVGSCGTNRERLIRRCRKLLEEIGGSDAVEYHRGWSWFIALPERQAATKLALMPVMKPEGGALSVEVAAGDTIAQARVLYSRDWPSGLDQMIAAGWEVSTNFHFGFISSNVHWAAPNLSLSDYWRFWRTSRGRSWLRKVRREQYDELIEELLGAGVVRETDEAAFRAQFVETGRDSVNVCPGLTLKYGIPLQEAAELDAREQLASFIAERFSEVGRTLGLSWAPPR